MKKDFSSHFDVEPYNVFLLIENQKNHRFALSYAEGDQDLEGKGYYAERGVYSLPRIDIEVGVDLASELIGVAKEYGLSLSRFREVDRETVLHYSFVDDTPGARHENIYMHLKGDAISNFEISGSIVFVEPQKVIDLLDYPANISGGVRRAISQIISD